MNRLLICFLLGCFALTPMVSHAVDVVNLSEETKTITLHYIGGSTTHEVAPNDRVRMHDSSLQIQVGDGPLVRTRLGEIWAVDENGLYIMRRERRFRQ